MVRSRNPTHPHAFAQSFIPSTRRVEPCQFSSRRPRLHSIRLLVKANASLSSPAQFGVEWLTERKGKVNELLDFSKIDERSKRCVTVSQKKSKVLKGTVLAEFPEGTFLTPAIARTLLEKESSPVTDASLNLGDESLLALCLLVELAKHDRSEYTGLLDALPNVGELDSPDFWSEEELKLLRGSPLYAKSIQIREAIEEEWNSLNTELFELNRKLFPEEDFSLEAYRWALGIVDSRTVPAGSTEGRVLAPVLINLRPPGGHSKATGRVEMSGGVFFSKKRVGLIADVDMAGGEEVTTLCGEGRYKSDQLLERGEVVEDGASKWEISFRLTELDRFYEDKIDILETVGLEGRTSFDMLEADENGQWEAPENLESFVRLMCLSGADAFLLEGVFRGEVWDFMGLPVSAENEKATCELMIGACEDGLEEYADDLDVGDVSKRRREMCSEVVEGEKKVLLAAVKSYKGRLKSLDGLEYYAERRLKMLDLLRPLDESEIVEPDSGGGRGGRGFEEDY